MAARTDGAKTVGLGIASMVKSCGSAKVVGPEQQNRSAERTMRKCKMPLAVAKEAKEAKKEAKEAKEEAKEAEKGVKEKKKQAKKDAKKHPEAKRLETKAACA
jgi:hypothetical protein